jgi:hypothetical protein
MPYFLANVLVTSVLPLALAPAKTIMKLLYKFDLLKTAKSDKQEYFF